MSRILLLILACSLFLHTGCAPVVVAGAAVGASMAHDRRTLGAQMDDQTIELKAGAAFSGDSALDRNAVHINIISMNGIVLLTGEAASTEARDTVLRHLRAINGVRRITNEIRINAPSSLGTRSKDSLITSAVKSRLLVTNNLDVTRFKVVTEAGTVYLMGLVTQAEGERGAEQAATIEGVTRVVKVFEYID